MDITPHQTHTETTELLQQKQYKIMRDSLTLVVNNINIDNIVSPLILGSICESNGSKDDTEDMVMATANRYTIKSCMEELPTPKSLVSNPSSLYIEQCHLVRHQGS